MTSRERPATSEGLNKMPTRAERSETFLKRGAEALSLRKSGLTLEQIGEAMGISRSRANQILRTYAERMADKKESPDVT
ncbi:RNA polymerase sigma-70 region 4 [uncultured Caudovirales phage]|uniref:RNA polymerase sigma-70 region 4 n=1 Tax=uncultured Caudovirales phage TaxID=2100421 RepID=A0A6J5R7F6_9CAUD|nr:RNA polymerase sigma-70 region 4 [uncultured Caudovirales phage]